MMVRVKELQRKLDHNVGKPVVPSRSMVTERHHFTLNARVARMEEELYRLHRKMDQNSEMLSTIVQGLMGLTPDKQNGSFIFPTTPSDISPRQPQADGGGVGFGDSVSMVSSRSRLFTTSQGKQPGPTRPHLQRRRETPLVLLLPQGLSPSASHQSIVTTTNATTPTNISNTNTTKASSSSTAIASNFPTSKDPNKQ